LRPLNDNTRFVSCGGDRQVFLWDVSTGKAVQKFQGHTLRVNSVDFNKDATVIVSGSYDSTIRLWDCRVTTKKCIQILEDAKDSVETVSIVDYEIITGSVDGHTRIYDIRTGTVIVDNIQSMIILTTEPVTAVQLSNDKNCLLSCSLDSIIRLLDKDTGELLCE
jgi:mitogen-activated protein kinase organizer 1